MIFVFGLLPAGLFAIGSFFMLPNVGILHSEVPEVTSTMKLAHFATFTPPLAIFM